MIIDIENTELIFGYNPDMLKPNSCKTVICYCEKCNSKHYKFYKDANRIKLCRLCSNKINSNTNIVLRAEKAREWHKNNAHPLLGTKRPEHVIEALRLSAKNRVVTIEQRIKASLNSSGKLNSFYGKKHSAESLLKMSIAQKKCARRGEKSNFYGRVYHPNRKDCLYKNIQFRSSWEVKFAVFLDNHNIIWEYEPKAFEVIITNAKNSYIPDFYLPASNEWIEVKGYWRKDALIKFNCFLEQYPHINIKIYDKKVLMDLEIL